MLSTKHHTVKVLVDSGATTASLISRTFAMRAGLEIEPTRQGARQFDKSMLDIAGETKFTISFGDIPLVVEGLINDCPDYDILAGVPFCAMMFYSLES